MDRKLFFDYIIRLYGRSLSARRAWIEKLIFFRWGGSVESLSARRAWIEKVFASPFSIFWIVALRKESVDRKNGPLTLRLKELKSLSARRAWIEKCPGKIWSTAFAVALRKESVDRKNQPIPTSQTSSVALRKESVDRKINTMQVIVIVMESLSARRAWIEKIFWICRMFSFAVALRKESVDRKAMFRLVRLLLGSVALRKESVDRKYRRLGTIQHS